MPTRDQILEALKVVIDPELHKDIVTLGMVRSIDIAETGAVNVTVSLTTPGCPIKGHFQSGVTNAVTALEGVSAVNVGFDVLTDQEKQGLQRTLGRAGGLPAGALAQVANVLCVGSGKGGVGKSTLTVNLAAALHAEGKKVGVLDADVWGYSIPRMLGLGGQRPSVSADRKILPLEAHGIKVISIGFFLKEDEAVVWRGPMLHKALTQFLDDVAWGELDYLLIDLPPGTGDVSMTLAQLLPQATFMLITTPQDAAQKVARRAAQMADKVNLEISSVVENMSGFTTPSGERFPIFGEGGGQTLARGAAARPGAADDAAARPRGRRHPARGRRPRRRGRAGDPSDRPRAHRDGAGQAGVAAGAGSRPDRPAAARGDVTPHGRLGPGERRRGRMIGVGRKGCPTSNHFPAK
jgi:ATP-binding protein involved in chromosome partitioning